MGGGLTVALGLLDGPGRLGYGGGQTEVRMDRRNVNTLTIGGTVAAASVTAFIAYRLYLRQRTLEELQEGVMALATARSLSQALGVRLNIPDPTEMATSLVPIFSLTTPYDAIEDVLVNGRQSAFWPAAYRDPGTLGNQEALIFDMLYRAYQKRQAEEVA